jgi:hypothetical protein
MVRRLLCATLLAVCSGAIAPVTAQAAPGLVVGIDDDSLKWAADPVATVGVLHDLGVQAIRVTVPWAAGESQLSAASLGLLDRVVTSAWGIRIVPAVYGKAREAPLTAASRADYCNFVADLLRAYPSINDVVIWNEPNVSQFWQPQFAPNRTSAAPAAYEGLLADCWDTLHAAHPSVNLIAASSPRGNDNPLAVSNISHSPGNWYRQLGLAYRASKRTRPILDTVGHNAYPTNSAERPWAPHKGASIAEGDYPKLMAALQGAFDGTGQPLPGQGAVRIWYLEQGFQSTIPTDKLALYSGRESDKFALQSSSPRATAGLATADQGTQLSDAVALAYCQPGVGAIFNFELADEPALIGWQSGVLWTDGTPKPSYPAFKQAIAAAGAGTVDCSRFPAPSRSTRPKP